ASVLFAAPAFWARFATVLDEQQDKTYFTGSVEARRLVLEEGWDTFLAFPWTGVGAGQFTNYNPPGRHERWRETHNALIQVAADTGFFGLMAFTFLVIRAATAAVSTRRLLKRTGQRSAPDPLDTVLSADDRSR